MKATHVKATKIALFLMLVLASSAALANAKSQHYVPVNPVRQNPLKAFVMHVFTLGMK